MTGFFEQLGIELGQLVEKKNQEYGSAFLKAGQFLELLYPNGIVPVQYADALLLVRIFDKQCRIAQNAHLSNTNENPYLDIAGYGLCGVRLHAKT